MRSFDQGIWKLSGRIAIVAAIACVGEAPARAEVSGRKVYQRYCAVCHGERGDGRGRNARYLDPRPRDFTLGVFKFRTTASGEAPTDRDLLRTVDYGVPGTSMPAWRGVLSRRQRQAVVHYIKGFSETFAKIERCTSNDDCDDYFACRQGRCRLIFTAPTPAAKAAIERGKAIYNEFKCWNCHGRDGRGHGPASRTLRDGQGYAIAAYDFTSGKSYKSGDKATDIYRTFMTGLSGTPMPSYADSITGRDRWDLVHFVRSLSARRSWLDYLFSDRPGDAKR